MANNRTLTAANAIIVLSVSGFASHRLQGFSADDVTSIGAVDISETSMGVDGRLSGGAIPAIKTQSFVLQADSESNDFVESWYGAQVAAGEVLIANGIIIFRSVVRKYAMTRGFLKNYTPLPAARKTLGPRTFTIDWQDVQPSPV